MAALDFTTPPRLPYVKRATLATTCQQITLPSSHGELILSIRVDSIGAKFATDPDLTDGGAMGSDYETMSADTVYEWTIPATAVAGVTKVFLAAASGTPSASIELTRRGLT